MEKYGFVYIWRDRKHKRYYIGSHWGREDDGYLCSSNWMKQAYKIRPEDFKRRILSRIYTSKIDTLMEEEKYLQMIKVEEIKIRYYNLHTTVHHWSQYPENIKTISQKIAFMKIGRKKSEELKKKHSESAKKTINNSGRFKKGCKRSKEEIIKREQTKKEKNLLNPRKGIKQTEELKVRKVWNKGLHLSKEHKENLSKSHKGKIPWNKGKKIK